MTNKHYTNEEIGEVMALDESKGGERTDEDGEWMADITFNPHAIHNTVIRQLQAKLRLYEEHVIILEHDAEPRDTDTVKITYGEEYYDYGLWNDVKTVSGIEWVDILRRDNKPVITLPPETKLEGR